MNFKNIAPIICGAAAAGVVSAVVITKAVKKHKKKAKKAAAHNKKKPVVKASDIQWPLEPNFVKKGKNYYMIRVPDIRKKSGYTVLIAKTEDKLEEKLFTCYDILFDK